MKWPLVVLGLVLGGCDGSGQDLDGTDLPAPLGPSLSHVPPVGPVPAGTPVELVLQADDEEGIEEAVLWWRQQGATLWETEAMVADPAQPWRYSATVTSQLPAVEYWFRAVDASDYAVSASLPAGGEAEAYLLEAQVVAKVLPADLGFDDALSENSLYDLGFSEQSDGFASTRWRLSKASAHSPEWSAWRPAGSADHVHDDWLVAPPVSFDGLPAAQVSWWQRTVQAGAAVPEGELSVWVSTTGGDLAVDAFTEVLREPLAANPEWSRRPALDLAAFAGEPSVWVALRVEGYGADVFVDDLAFSGLQPDLVVEDIDQDHIDPGSTGNVYVQLKNYGAETDGSLVVALESDTPGISFGPPDVVGVVGQGAAPLATVSLSAGAGVPDNSLVAVDVVATDGSSSWTFPASLVIGDRSTFSVDVTTTTLGVLRLWVGKGDPAAPVLEEEIVQAVVPPGVWHYDHDLTGLNAELPPGPGPDRWYVRVGTTGAFSVWAYGLTHDGVSYPGLDTGTWPAGEEVLYLPQRPLVTVDAQALTPEVLSPGASATWTLTVTNQTTVTVGHTEATLTSSDPDVTVSAAPLVLSETGWAPGEAASFVAELAVAASQNDGQDLAFDLVISDEFESVVVPLALPVPWARLVTTSLSVDDFLGGDGDALVEVGETIELGLSLTNVGSRDTGPGVACTLSDLPGGPEATVVQGDLDLGVVLVGATKSDGDLEVTVVDGLPGDLLSLGLSCVDDDGLSYEASVDIVLGEPQWQALQTLPDAVGDAVDAYMVDFDVIRWRIDGDELAFEIHSDSVIDPAAMFIESWASSPGASQDYYQLVVQGTSAKVRGYSYAAGYSALVDATVTVVDDHTVVVAWDLAAMGLVVDTLDVGFASGFCPSSYFCDQMPEGWGNPYQTGLNAEAFATIAW